MTFLRLCSRAPWMTRESVPIGRASVKASADTPGRRALSSSDGTRPRETHRCSRTSRPSTARCSSRGSARPSRPAIPRPRPTAPRSPSAGSGSTGSRATRSAASASSSADGTDLRQITDGPNDDSEPRWSPDGRRLSFRSDRASKGQHQLFVLDTGGARRGPSAHHAAGHRGVASVVAPTARACWPGSPAPPPSRPMRSARARSAASRTCRRGCPRWSRSTTPRASGARCGWSTSAPARRAGFPREDRNVWEADWCGARSRGRGHVRRRRRGRLVRRGRGRHRPRHRRRTAARDERRAVRMGRGLALRRPGGRDRGRVQRPRRRLRRPARDRRRRAARPRQSISATSTPRGRGGSTTTGCWCSGGAGCDRWRSRSRSRAATCGSVGRPTRSVGELYHPSGRALRRRRSRCSCRRTGPPRPSSRSTRRRRTGGGRPAPRRPRRRARCDRPPRAAALDRERRARDRGRR